MTTYHRLHVVKRLNVGIRFMGLRAFARQLKVSPGYLCDVVKGRSAPGPKILRALKLEVVPPVIRYRWSSRGGAGQ